MEQWEWDVGTGSSSHFELPYTYSLTVSNAIIISNLVFNKVEDGFMAGKTGENVQKAARRKLNIVFLLIYIALMLFNILSFYTEAEIGEVRVTKKVFFDYVQLEVNGVKMYCRQGKLKDIDFEDIYCLAYKYNYFFPSLRLVIKVIPVNEDKTVT